MTTSSDQRALINAVIAQERVTVAFYKARLVEETRPAFAARIRGLMAYHRRQIKRWKGEL